MNKINEYGFIAGTDMSVQFESDLVDNAERIAAIMGLDKNMVGSGIRVSVSDSNDVDLDHIANIVDIRIKDPLVPSAFVYSWAMALHHYNFLESYNEANAGLMYTTVSKAEAVDRITVRWKGIEMGIQDVLTSLFDTNEDPELVSRAIRNFHSDISSSFVSSTESASAAIAKLQASAESLGCHMSNDVSSMMAMLIGMRSDCVSEIQNIKMLDDDAVRVPIRYVARMMDLSEQTGTDDILLSAPAIAIASFVTRKMDITLSSSDPRVLPTEDEFNEITGRMPEFIAHIQSSTHPLFDSADHQVAAPESLSRKLKI